MRKGLLLLILGLTLLGACKREESDGGTNGPLVPETERTVVTSAAQEVAFPTSDDLTLRGTLYGSGERAVIFAHEPNSDRSDWQPLAVEMATRGYMTLVFDMRGHGESHGSIVLGRFRDDIEAAIDFIEARGANAYVLVGSDYGGMETIHVAAERDPAAVVLISVPESASFNNLERSVRDEDLQRIEAPTLLIVAEDDHPVFTIESSSVTVEGPDYHQAMSNIRERMSEPVEFLVLEGSAHGRRLLDSRQRDALVTSVIQFIETHAPAEQQRATPDRERDKWGGKEKRGRPVATVPCWLCWLP